MRRNIVITRKDKRLFKTGHTVAFLLTGGTSAAYTAAKAATNAGYNARTRNLEAESAIPPATPRGGWVNECSECRFHGPGNHFAGSLTAPACSRYDDSK